MIKGMETEGLEGAEVKTGWWSRRSNRALVGAAASYVVIGGLLLVFVPEMLLQNWLPGSDPQERAKLLGIAAQIVLFGLGGVIAIVGVTLSVARHQEELESQDRDRERLANDLAKELARKDEWEVERRRDIERELRTRFVTTVDMFTSTSSIKRTAAFFAMGALADDWDAHGRADESQVCIDVLCAYLRRPLPEELDPARLEVEAERSAGFDVLAKHLSGSPARSWGSRKINLEGIEITQTLQIEKMLIDGGSVSFAQAVLSSTARLRLPGARISNGSLHLNGAQLAGAAVIDLEECVISDGSLVSLARARIGGGASVSFYGANVSGNSRIALSQVEVGSGGSISFEDAKIHDSRLHFPGVSILDRAVVTFDGASIGGNSRVSLGMSELSGTLDLSGLSVSGSSQVLLGGATLRSGGALTLRGAAIDPNGPIVLPEGERLTPAVPPRRPGTRQMN